MRASEGLFFLRFDLTTTIVAHFAYNAGLTALPLLRSGEPYFVASGTVVIAAMLAPMIPNAVKEIQHRLRGEARDIVRPWIRPGGTGDLEALAALPIKGLDWGALLGHPEAVVLCLQAGEKIVGVAAGQIATEAEGKALAVYVAPSWRRRYQGSELMEMLRARLQEQGAQLIRAEMSMGDKVGMCFMTSQGWKREKVIFNWPPEPPSIPDWRDALKKLRIMRKAKQQRPEKIDDR